MDRGTPFFMTNSKILEGRLLSCQFPTSEGFSAPTMVLKQQSLGLKKPYGLRPQVPLVTNGDHRPGVMLMSGSEQNQSISSSPSWCEGQVAQQREDLEQDLN